MKKVKPPRELIQNHAGLRRGCPNRRVLQPACAKETPLCKYPLRTHIRSLVNLAVCLYHCYHCIREQACVGRVPSTNVVVFLILDNETVGCFSKASDLWPFHTCGASPILLRYCLDGSSKRFLICDGSLAAVQLCDKRRAELYTRFHSLGSRAVGLVVITQEQPGPPISYAFERRW